MTSLTPDPASQINSRCSPHVSCETIFKFPAIFCSLVVVPIVGGVDLQYVEVLVSTYLRDRYDVGTKRETRHNLIMPTLGIEKRIMFCDVVQYTAKRSMPVLKWCAF